MEFTSNAKMVVVEQADLDAAFADMEHLLADERSLPIQYSGGCICCGGGEFVYNGPSHGHPGSRICNTCGVVERGHVFYETMFGKCLPTRSSNYKRIHHWHERISQLLLAESQIPEAHMLQIGERICDGTHKVINKDVIRAVLRSLNMQQYIEKWLQIIYRITGVAPPCPGTGMLKQLDALFDELQRPFDAHRADGRKNFLNYNYVFCRLLQMMECSRYCMFFPLIKSKLKLKALDDMWSAMADGVSWPVKPLAMVPPFAVQLEQSAALLETLKKRCATLARVEPASEQMKTVYRPWDHSSSSNSKRKQSPLHSVQLEPELQKFGLVKRRLR